MGLFGAIGGAVKKVAKHEASTMKENAKGRVNDMKKKPFMSLIMGGMKKKKATTAALVLAVLSLLPGIARAQSTATPADRLGWTQVGQSQATAQGMVYKAYIDASTTGVVVTSVTCSTSGSNATCSSALPAMTTGNHAITLTQGNGTVESAKSTALNVTFVVFVTPTGLQIVRFDELPISDQLAHKLAVSIARTPLRSYFGRVAMAGGPS